MIASSYSAPLLATQGLTKSFRSLVALKDYEFSVQRGEIVGVIGPNGSGQEHLLQSGERLPAG